MADRYQAAWTKTGADSVTELAEVLSSATTRRTRWRDILVGCATASQDGQFSIVARRVTGTATGTALTPRPTDPAAPAALSTAKHLITADAASFAAGEELVRFPLNGRASFRWAVSEDGELIAPATASNGIAVGLGAASTLTFGGTIGFWE